VLHPDAATRVQTKAAETQATRAKYQASQRFETAGWNHSGDYSGGADALENTFQRWKLRRS